jgi:hypothetical protein
MTRRYVVTQAPGGTRWGIKDTRLDGFCTLPQSDTPKGHAPALLPLEWNGRPAAEAWLYMCRVAWGAGYVPAPEGWDAR